jgi:hypothetical protein
MINLAMLSELFFKKKGDRYRSNYILFSFLVSLLGFGTAWLLFPHGISYAFPLIVTVLLVPAFRKLIKLEEQEIVRKRKLSRVFHYHSDVVEISFFVFVGVFLALLLVQLASVSHPAFFSHAFEYQVESVATVQSYTADITDNLVLGDSTPRSYRGLVHMLVTTFVLLTVGFLLGAFYGSGGILIIVLAAAQFATLAVYIVTSRGPFLNDFLITALLHVLMLIPLILAAIGGGILSKAVVREKLHSRNFKTVLADSLLLYSGGIVLSVLLVGVWLVFVHVVV